jgi:hypothetical protein
VVVLSMGDESSKLTKAGIMPKENTAVAIIGTIQWIFVSTDQP